MLGFAATGFFTAASCAIGAVLTGGARLAESSVVHLRRWPRFPIEYREAGGVDWAASAGICQRKPANAKGF